MKLVEVKLVSTPLLTRSQKDWLDSAIGRGKWMFNDKTNQVDVNGDVNVRPGVTQLPVTFGNVSGNFDAGLSSLTTLEGCPINVGASFVCYDTKITSLKGAPRHVGTSFGCSNTDITSLEGLPDFIGGTFVCNSAPIVNRVLQLLRYPQIKRVMIMDGQLNKILNRYLAESDRDILACQDELIDAGYADIARL